MRHLFLVDQSCENNGDHRDAVPSEQENDDSKSQRAGHREGERSEHQTMIDLGEDNKVSPETDPGDNCMNEPVRSQSRVPVRRPGDELDAGERHEKTPHLLRIGQSYGDRAEGDGETCADGSGCRCSKGRESQA